MKKFVTILSINSYYNYEVYRITDYYGRGYFVAEPMVPAATRAAETIEALEEILNKDVNYLNSLGHRRR